MPDKQNLTVTVGIPAYNEEGNIAALLESLLKQETKSFVLDKIVVVGDGCSDGTIEEVKRISLKTPLVSYLDNAERCGKAQRVMDLCELNESDVLVVIDGDVALKTPHALENLIEMFSTKKVGLVSGWDQPLPPRNWLEALFIWSDHLWFEIKKDINGGRTIHNHSGRFFALNKKFVQDLTVPPNTIASDDFVFVEAFRKGWEFRFAKEAIAFYRMPNNLPEFLLQSRRFLGLKNELVDHYGTDILEVYKIGFRKKIRGLLRVFKRNPLYTLVAVFLQVWVRVLPNTTAKPRRGYWTTVDSSKRLYNLPAKKEQIMQKQTTSLTVGIPTYYGGPGLVQTVKSILTSASQARSNGLGEFRLIVSVDANPLENSIHKELEDLGVEVIDNKERGGQVVRIKQIISLCDSDILVTTQDDILFDQNTLTKILKAFEENPEVTMIGANVRPAPATTLFEKFIEVGVNSTHRIGNLWNKGDNYLLASGRCLAFRTGMAKRFTIPDEVVNSDAYLYFENKRLGGVFKPISSAHVYNKSPQNMAEHLKQSKRFQSSFREIRKYLDIELKKEYAVPVYIKARALIGEFLKNPFFTIGYLGVLVYTRLQQKRESSKEKRFWETDLSTKRAA